MDTSQLSNEIIAAIIGTIAVLLTGGGAVGGVKFKRFLAGISASASAAAADAKIISAQFENNHGTSMKDSIDRLISVVERMEHRQMMGEQRTKALMNSDPHTGYFETDEKGSCLWASRGYLRRLGKGLDEVQGNEWLGSVAYEDRVRVTAEWRDAVSQSRNFHSRHNLIDSNGNVIPVICTASLVRNDAKVPIGHVGTVTVVDPSERLSTKEHTTTEGR